MSVVVNLDGKTLADFVTTYSAQNNSVGTYTPIGSTSVPNVSIPPYFPPPAPCPSCGHCPTCGRGGHYPTPFPITTPWWNPFIYGSSQTTPPNT